MATKYIRADKNRWPGVYVYHLQSRTATGREYQNLSKAAKKNLKPDICYMIAYKLDGKLHWEKIGLKSEGYTPQIAAEIRGKRLRKARHGEEAKTQKEIRKEEQKQDRTLDDIKKEYFKHRGGDPRSAKFDRLRYDKHVKPVLGQRRISSLGPLDMKRIEQNMKGYAPATVWGALELVRRISNFGLKAGLCKPLGFIIEMPERDNEVVEFLEPEETRRFVKVLDEWPNQVTPRMLKLAMFSGMRKGEIFKLQDRHLDFRHGLITLGIPGTRDKPKGGKTVTIAMNPVTREILQEQIAYRDTIFPDSLYVFPGRTGGMRTACSAADRIKRKAELPKEFRIFHGLRHHFAVTLANSGEYGLDMIGELLTHKSLEMTKRYAQFLPETMQKSSSRAAELLQKGYVEADENQAKIVHITQGHK